MVELVDRPVKVTPLKQTNEKYMTNQNNDLTRFKIKGYSFRAFEGNLIQMRDLVVPCAHIALVADGLTYVLDYPFVPRLDSNEDGEFVSKKSTEIAQSFIDVIIKKTGIVNLTNWITEEEYIRKLGIRN